MTFDSNKHKRQTVTNYKQHKSIVPHDSTKPPKNPRTTNACTYHPGTHTPCTHAHTNNNPSDQAHPHTHKNDTNSCKLFELRTNFVRNSYEIRNNRVLRDEIRTKFVRNSHKIRTKFVRNSHEFRTNFVRTSYESRTIFAGHWQKSHTNTTYACTGVPTPTHISLYLPPRHPHTHTVQQCTHTHTPHMLLLLYEIKSTPFAHGGPPEHLGDLQMWPLGTTPPHSFVGRPH